MSNIFAPYIKNLETHLLILIVLNFDPCAQYVGDGECDDAINYEECNYDGGDCCGPALSCK